jgi:hypothetical protein
VRARLPLLLLACLGLGWAARPDGQPVTPPFPAPFAVPAAGAAGVPATPIGTVLPGPSALTIVGPDGRPMPLPQRTGWDHF